jgi:hypothetical protein
MEQPPQRKIEREKNEDTRKKKKKRVNSTLEDKIKPNPNTVSCSCAIKSKRVKDIYEETIKHPNQRNQIQPRYREAQSQPKHPKEARARVYAHHRNTNIKTTHSQPQP